MRTRVEVDERVEALTVDNESILRELLHDGRTRIHHPGHCHRLERGTSSVSAAVVRYVGNGIFGRELCGGFWLAICIADLQLIIKPVRLAEVLGVLARSDHVMFAVATTGTMSLTVSVACDRIEKLFRYKVCVRYSDRASD